VGRFTTPRRVPRRLAPVLALAVVLVASVPGRSQDDAECPRWRAAFASMPEVRVTIHTGGRAISRRARFAASAEQQAAGFQCATPAEIHRTLILFDFGEEILTQFHMRHVPAPLDIAFVKADGRIFSILRMAPSATALYGPFGPFRWALEARAGYFQSQGVRQGAARLSVAESSRPAPK
jgi:uncharacterized membrane protein (UPF0127 family)